MRKFFTALVLIPLGVIFLAFAIANRRLVTVSFDPFNATDPSVGLTRVQCGGQSAGDVVTESPVSGE